MAIHIGENSYSHVAAQQLRGRSRYIRSKRRRADARPPQIQRAPLSFSLSKS
jgi:hypothetical protein